MNTNDVVVVLGPGRSGTSLLTSLLVKFGMTGVEDAEVTGDQNPLGDYEDRDVNKINMDVYRFLSASPRFPIDSDFMGAPGVSGLVKSVRAFLREKIDSVGGLWGFKDPKTASLLPLWIRVFNEEKVRPRYILAIRNPAPVVASFHKNYSMGRALAELIWLHRTCDALYHTGGNCFISHYEDWFGAEASKHAAELVGYVGLPVLEAEMISRELREIVSPALNRAQYDEGSILNPYVTKLYSALCVCHGAEFERKALMDVVLECRAAIGAFSGWWQSAQDFNKMIGAREKKAAKGGDTAAAKLVDLSNKYLAEAEESSRQVRDLKAELGILSKENQDLRAKISQVAALKGSKAYQAGRLLVSAIRSPWPKIFLLPPRLIKLALRSGGE